MLIGRRPLGISGHARWMIGLALIGGSGWGRSALAQSGAATANANANAGTSGPAGASPKKPATGGATPAEGAAASPFTTQPGPVVPPATVVPRPATPPTVAPSTPVGLPALPTASPAPAAGPVGGGTGRRDRARDVRRVPPGSVPAPFLVPLVQFWRDLGRGRVIRGAFSEGTGTNAPAKGETLVSQLATGQTVTPHDKPISAISPTTWP